MKHFYYLFFLIFFSFAHSQSVSLVKDFSFERNGLVSEYISLQFMLDENGKADDEIIVSNGTRSLFSHFILKFEDINEFKQFLIEGKNKFYEWDSIRKVNGIKEMVKQIDVFKTNVRFWGDDYGVFSTTSQVELNYVSWKSGSSVMQLKVSGNDGVRSDIYAQYLCYGNKEKTVSKNFNIFLDEFTLDFLKSEQNKINNKSDLFN